MDKPLEYHTLMLLNVAECLETNKQDWAKRVPHQRRKDLITFIDDPTAEVDDSFMDVFNRIVASLGSKITLKLFELVLKIGVNFATPENDAYWFALFKCADYGAVFDQPDICELLIDEVFLVNSNSWKAACTLCILVQDYSSTVKGIVTRLLFKDVTRVLSLFHDINDYTLCCYMTELLSQINAPQLLSQIFSEDLKIKIINGVYANDHYCTQFLGQFNQINTIHHINSFSIEGVVQCGLSICQLYPYFFVVLVNQNEYTAPIQFEFSEINGVQNNDNKVRFHLGQQPTKTLLSVDISPLSIVDLEFSNAQVACSIVEALNKVTNHTMMSTPRKISVVQNFIKINSRVYEQEDEASSLSDVIISDSSSKATDKNAIPISDDDKAGTVHSTSDVSFIPEDDSMFGSPALNNTTKNTSTSRHGRAISVAIADYAKKGITPIEPISTINPSDLAIKSNMPFIEVPDSTDTALNELNKGNKVRQSSPSTSMPPPSPKKAHIIKPVYKKTSMKAPAAPIDIWDFDDSDPEKTLCCSNPMSKAMTFLKKSTGRAHQKVSATKKTAVQKRLENADMVPEVPTKDIIVQSNDSHLLMSEPFSGLTSPLASRHEKATFNATMKRRVDEMPEYEDSIDDSELPLAQKKRKTHTTLDDESYKPSQIIQPTPKKKNTTTTKTQQHNPTPAINKPVTRAANVPLQQIDESDKNSRTTTTKLPKKAPHPPKKAITQKANTIEANVSKPLIESTEANINATRVAVQNPKVVIAPIAQAHKKMSQEHQQLISSLTPPDLLNANMLLSEAYTNTLQKQIYDSINTFSNELVKKIQIINDEINKKVMTDLTNKYETLFNELSGSFQKDVDEMCGFIGDVKGLLNLPEKQLVDYIKQKKFGQISTGDNEEN